MTSWWEFVHNAIAHPLLALFPRTLWVHELHDWTAGRAFGEEGE